MTCRIGVGGKPRRRALADFERKSAIRQEHHEESQLRTRLESRVSRAPHRDRWPGRWPEWAARSLTGAEARSRFRLGGWNLKLPAERQPSLGSTAARRHQRPDEEGGARLCLVHYMWQFVAMLRRQSTMQFRRVSSQIRIRPANSIESARFVPVVDLAAASSN
jgi:hypothetical protein